MRQYLNILIEQFRLATGSKIADIHSETFVSDFSAWLINRQKIAKEYVSFLDYMGFHYADIDTAEVDKSEYDSVVKPFETTLITRAPIKSINPERIIIGSMRVYDSVPILVNASQKKGISQVIQVPNDIIHTFMTQNPFTKQNISGWESLHNSGKNDIILGIYGSIHDKDIESKFEQMESL